MLSDSDKSVCLSGMINPLKILLSISLISFIPLNCANQKVTKKFAKEPPDWVLNIPREEGKIFAVGSCGRTYVQADAWEGASDAARNELAKNLQARIRNAFLFMQSSDGRNWADEAFVVEATASATDIVMENSQITALWYDETGVVPGSTPSTTYALAVLNLAKATEVIKPKIENEVTSEQYDKIINAISTNPKNEGK